MGKAKCIQRVTVFAILFIILSFMIQGCFEKAPLVPPTAIKPVTDIYHGVEVVDNYRWLEDETSPDVRNWSEAQNNYARCKLDNIPVREDIKK